MFGFAQWDSPVALLLEALLSVAVVAALFFVVRRVNAQASSERERYLQSRNQAGPTDQQSASGETPLPPVNGQSDTK